jgi:hypothetical protein
LKIRNEIAVEIFGGDSEDDKIGINADFGSGFALLGGRLWQRLHSGGWSFLRRRLLGYREGEESSPHRGK